MPFPALACHPAPLDLDHLARMTGGEKALERDVLELFLRQTGRLLDAASNNPAELAALSHILKGSARAIGAFRVADCADALEQAALKRGDVTEPFVELREAVTAASGAIKARLSRL